MDLTAFTGLRLQYKTVVCMWEGVILVDVTIDDMLGFRLGLDSIEAWNPNRKTIR